MLTYNNTRRERLPYCFNTRNWFSTASVWVVSIAEMDIHRTNLKQCIIGIHTLSAQVQLDHPVHMLMQNGTTYTCPNS